MEPTREQLRRGLDALRAKIEPQLDAIEAEERAAGPRRAKTMHLLAIDCTTPYNRDGRRIVNLDHLICARWEYCRRDPEPDVLYLVLDLTHDNCVSVPDGDEARRVWGRLQSLEIKAGGESR